MNRFSSLPRRAGRLRPVAIACLFSVALLAFAFTHGGRLTAQTTRDLPVIYNKCRHPAEGLKGVWIDDRHPSCGVDEEAIRAARETWERTERFRREAEANNRPLTPQEEQRVSQYIQKRFLADKTSDRRAELRRLLDTAANRLDSLLTGQAFAFIEEEQRQLQTAHELVSSLAAEYDRPTLTTRDIRSVRDRLAPVLTDVQRLVTQKERSATSEGPSIENLVTRIDSLVARVGTVIRDLERAGESVPQVVRDGHRRASELVRTAKRGCSLRRPTACSSLREVLEVLETMREPLCAIDSDLITFCN